MKHRKRKTFTAAPDEPFQVQITPKGIVLAVEIAVQEGWLPIARLLRARELLKQSKGWDDPAMRELFRESQRASREMMASAGDFPLSRRRQRKIEDHGFPSGPYKQENLQWILDCERLVREIEEGQAEYTPENLTRASDLLRPGLALGSRTRRLIERFFRAARAGRGYPQDRSK